MKQASEQRGLYDPQTEHDSCGLGFVAHMKGEKSHEIVDDAITILKNLIHRGACGCEENTGDGVGILIQKPHKFLKRVCAEINIELPEFDSYGAGMVFLPKDPEQSKFCQEQFEKIIEEEREKGVFIKEKKLIDKDIGEVELDDEIKVEIYKEVAEIIGFVLSMKKKKK